MRGRARETGRARRGPRRSTLLAGLAVLVASGVLLWIAATLTSDGASAPGAPAAPPPAPSEAGGSPGGRAAGEAALAGGAGLPAVASATPGGHLARARSLLAANSASAPAGTRRGVDEAEAEVRAAIQGGYGDRAAAFRLLADVYATQREWEERDELRRDYGEREREALRVVLEATPADGELRFRLAMLLDDRGARVAELSRAARDAPGDPRPRRAMGEELLASGSADEGARLLVEAAELASREQLGVIGPDLVQILRQYGREEEEARVRERMERLGY